MKSISGRLARLEKLRQKRNPRPVIIGVRVVDEITPAMRQAQREARARGDRYYIVEPQEGEHANGIDN